MTDFFDEISSRAEALRTFTSASAHQLRDFTRRLEQILTQDHRKIAIRDDAFAADFAQFATQLRKDTDGILDYWQHVREYTHSAEFKTLEPSSLQAKGFVLRAKTISRACDDFTTAYDGFNFFYKNYTLAKLPVWILTACCDDINNLTGKILFLSREITRKTETHRRSAHARG